MSNNNPAIGTKEIYKEEILKKIGGKPKVLEAIEEQPKNEFDQIWNMNNKIVGLFEKNIEKDQKMRNIYAIILLGILIAELIALVVIFILIGCDVLHYSELAMDLFITGGIAEVFVLVKVIVQYLFKDNLTNALNIILRNNNQVKYKNKKNKISDKP